MYEQKQLDRTIYDD